MDMADDAARKLLWQDLATFAESDVVKVADRERAQRLAWLGLDSRGADDLNSGGDHAPH
ncbi:MAG: hypothetical protein ABW164_11600 [Sphingobium sp.]